MTTQPDKRLLIIVVLVFGIVATAASTRWLSTGAIVIRKGTTRVGVGQSPPRPGPQPNAPAAGRIAADHALYYPLCITWIALGLSMVALPTLWFFTSNERWLKLSAYSCLAILLLAFTTVAVALWSGP